MRAWPLAAQLPVSITFSWQWLLAGFGSTLITTGASSVAIDGDLLQWMPFFDLPLEFGNHLVGDLIPFRLGSDVVVDRDHSQSGVIGDRYCAIQS